MQKITKFYLISGFVLSIIVTVGLLIYSENILFGYINFNDILDILFFNIYTYVGIAIGTFSFALLIYTFSLIDKENNLKIFKYMFISLFGVYFVTSLPMQVMFDLAIDLPEVDNTISCKYEQKNSQKLIACSNGYIYHLSANIEDKIEKVEVKETLNYLIQL